MSLTAIGVGMAALAVIGGGLGIGFATSSAVKVAITATRPMVNADTNIFCRIGPRSKIQQNAMLISICIRLA